MRKALCIMLAVATAIVSVMISVSLIENDATANWTTSSANVSSSNTEVTGATTSDFNAVIGNDSGNIIDDGYTLATERKEFPFAGTEARIANQGSAAYANYCALTATNFDSMQLVTDWDAFPAVGTEQTFNEVIDLRRNQFAHYSYTVKWNDLRRNAAANPILRA